MLFVFFQQMLANVIFLIYGLVFFHNRLCLGTTMPSVYTFVYRNNKLSKYLINFGLVIISSEKIPRAITFPFL
jgi:hypothetical protein